MSYDRNFASDQVVLNPGRRSRSRSRSPRPVRRRSTGERELHFLGYPDREKAKRSNRRQLLAIEEDSEVSISSEDNDDDKLLRRSRHQLRGTDKKLLDKTLKEDIGPSRPSEGNAGSVSPVLTARDAAKTGGEMHFTIVITTNPSGNKCAQPIVEVIADDEVH